MFMKKVCCSLLFVLIILLTSCHFGDNGIAVFEPCTDDKEVVIVANHPANIRRTAEWSTEILALIDQINALTEDDIIRYRQFSDLYDGEQCTDFLFVDAVTQNGLQTKSLWFYLMQDNTCLVRIAESEYADDGTFLRDTETAVFTHTNEKIIQMILELIDSYSDQS